MAIKKTIEQNQKQLPNSDLLLTLQKALPQYFDVYGNFKLDKFESELKENNIAEARDGYRLNFVGKDYARLQTGQSSETVIVPDNTHNSKPENINSENVFITGDNLEVLRHLQNAYASKIKMIYIDPPYNTGKEFVYNDQFEFNDEKLIKTLGYSEIEIERLKSIQGKSSHSAWLTFIYPRLKLAQKLLTDDGVIFVSIDDNEQANLKLILDDIFGEANFVASMIWNTGRKSMAKLIATNHEYCLIYAKNLNQQSADEIKLEESEDEFSGKLWREKKQGLEAIYQKYNELKSLLKDDYNKISKGLKEFYNSLSDDNPSKSHEHYCYADERGVYFPDNTSAPDKPETRSHEPLIHPITKKPTAVPEMGWRYTNETLAKLVRENRIHFGKSEKTVPNKKTYLFDTEYSVPSSIFYRDARGARSRLKTLFDGIDIFSFPKDEEVIKKFIRYCVVDGDIVLDFFAGSGTTAHAIMQLNAEDNGKGSRKFIMAQLNEKTNPSSEAFKAGYHTIDEISRQRIILCAQKIKKENALFSSTLDLGFKHYRLIEPSRKVIDKILEFDPSSNKLFEDDMIKPFEFIETNTTGLDTILQTWLIQDGYDFNTKIENILLEEYSAQYVKSGQTLYLINNGFNGEALKCLLNKIGKEKLIVQTIFVYPYSFTFEQMRELKYNLKTNLNIESLIERY